MEISLVDRSHYFKGLLLLIRKDQQITDPEIKLMKHIGKVLSFEEVFCEKTIHEVLENKYIEDIPHRFSTKEIAMKFIKDGITIGFSDQELHPSEEEWLELTAKENDLDTCWVSQELKNMKSRKLPIRPLEVEGLRVSFS